MHYRVYTDGGARGNPGPAGCWVYLINLTTTIEERRYKYIGVATNNVAEYTAALLGISRAIELWATRVDLYADSLLVIEQLSGNYRIKNVHLREIYLKIQEILRTWWWSITFSHVPRAENTEADRLSNIAMDRGQG